MNHLFALTRKEIIQILRDPVSLILMFVMPGFMMILFGVAISLDVDRIALAVWDLDQTPSSREFIKLLTESHYFQTVAYVDNDREINRMIDSGDASVAVKIPPDFEQNLKAVQPSPVRLVVDGADSNTANITLSYINLIVQRYSTDQLVKGLERRGIPMERLDLPVKFEPRVWYNPELVSENFFIPGLIALIMMVNTTALTAMSIVREKDRGTIEMLMVAPISRLQLVLAKIFPYFVMSFINIFVLIVLSGALFGVPFRGSVSLLVALSALFLLTALGFGVFLSTLSSSQQVAWTLCMLTTALPSFMLSGFIFPIESMPWGIRIFTYLVPVRYFMVIVRGIILKGVGAESLAPQIISLVVFALIMIVLSARRISRRLT